MVEGVHWLINLNSLVIGPGMLRVTRRKPGDGRPRRRRGVCVERNARNFASCSLYDLYLLSTNR
jgi:hypothetical protein